MERLLRKIREVLQHFINWPWETFAPPVMKPWRDFLLGGQNPGVAFPLPEPAGDLDDKMQQVSDAFKATSAPSRTYVHVVCRACWRYWDDPKAAVVGCRPFAKLRRSWS